MTFPSFKSPLQQDKTRRKENHVMYKIIIFFYEWYSRVYLKSISFQSNLKKIQYYCCDIKFQRQKYEEYKKNTQRYWNEWLGKNREQLIGKLSCCCHRSATGSSQKSYELSERAEKIKENRRMYEKRKKLCEFNILLGYRIEIWSRQ